MSQLGEVRMDKIGTVAVLCHLDVVLHLSVVHPPLNDIRLRIPELVLLLLLFLCCLLFNTNSLEVCPRPQVVHVPVESVA